MSSRISKLASDIQEFESEIKSLNQQKAELSAQQSTSEAGGSPSEIARNAQAASMEAQKRRSELESVNAAITTLTKHLGQRQGELAQAQQQERREALSCEVETLRSGVGQAVEAANELSSQLQTQLIELKTLANQAQPAYSQWQREFSNVGNKPENLLEVGFTGIPVIVKQGENFSLEGEKINLFWVEQEAKSELKAQQRAWRAGSQERFERGARRREAENLAKHQAALEAQRTAKEIELEDFKQKLREARDSGYSNTSSIEAAIAQTHQQILDLNKQINELTQQQEKLQNDTAA